MNDEVLSGESSVIGSFIQKYSDVIIAVTLVMIVIMMIIPLPTTLLDLLICLNISGFIGLPVVAFGDDAFSACAQHFVNAADFD